MHTHMHTCEQVTSCVSSHGTLSAPEGDDEREGGRK